ncbi:hypothetical protein Cantr_03139 [Candida viswanathii]|uniref:NADP-dependent oxidoreductase YfmJ n=1 Tax=Candida viswanathii TaxID=5486 RepID=A0A367YMS8_9ASCO|nr:hypothetical protein Cantr_03139 [Candida viswanathii]
MTLPSLATEVVLKQPPSGYPNPAFGQPDSTFAIKHAEFPLHLRDGEVIVKTLFLSNDPTQRSWIRSSEEKRRHYTKPVQPGSPMQSLGLGEVVKSNSENYKVGDIVNARLRWADYSVLPDTDLFNTIDTSLGFPLEYYLSVFGMTALTAFFGLTEAGDLKKYLNFPSGTGPIVAVSAASGATGSIVVQIAKHVLGASKVIGVAGSDEKAKWVESLGADICVNYKNPDYQEQISTFLGDKFVDAYFDNVGGEILSFFLTKVRKFGRVIACGSIAGYNNKEALKVSNWGEITINSLTVQGFLVSNYRDQFPEALRILAEAVKTGKIATKDAYHVEEIHGSDLILRLQEIPKIWVQLFNGEKQQGKLITKVANP